jgi:steroid delta-isomerase-like uncharacterized protein
LSSGLQIGRIEQLRRLTEAKSQGTEAKSQGFLLFFGMASMKKGMLKLFRRKDKEVPKDVVRTTTVKAASEYNPNVQEQPDSLPQQQHSQEHDSLEDADWSSSSHESMNHEIVEGPKITSNVEREQQPQPTPLATLPKDNGSDELNANLNLEREAQLTATTRELVKKFVADIWNKGDLELIPRVCSKGLRFNGFNGMNRVGHDGFARMVTTIRDALDDYHCEIHSMVVEGNKAFCRVRFTGTHNGTFLGYPPTGRRVAWLGATEFTCKDGLIFKVWELGDFKSLEEQLSGSN